MTYRPLSHNESIFVDRTLSDVRGLSDGAAASLRMIYSAYAKRDDKPEFDVFKESEEERMQSTAIDEKKFTELDGTVELLEFLDSELKSNSTGGKPQNLLDWFFGDERLLDAKSKRLRVLFYNSARYREQVLFTELERGTLSLCDLSDIDLIRLKLTEFNEKYPGTKTGVLSNYELYFGDPSEFSYSMAMERAAFHNDPAARSQFLAQYNLPADWSIDDIRDFLVSRMPPN